MFDDVHDAARGRRPWLVALAVSVAVIAAICVGATPTGAASAAEPAETPAAAPPGTPDDVDDPGGEEDDGPIAGADGGHTTDGALQGTLPAATIPSTQQN